MDLRQLEYFLRVAQRKNISLAAAELNIAQPTLTKSIKLLEEQLGVKLFERLPRGVVLTSFGTTLLRHAEAVHVQMKDAGHEIAAQRSGAVGTVAIGAGPTWLRRYLPAALARTISSHPSIRVRVEAGFDESLFRALRQGEFDFVEFRSPYLHHPEEDDGRGYGLIGGTIDAVASLLHGLRILRAHTFLHFMLLRRRYVPAKQSN
ncbi:LysR family transcriptional regulator [Bradyrhizobium sp. UFLA05-112]